MQRHAADNGMVVDGDIGALLHVAVFAAAEHAHHLCVARNQDDSAIDERILIKLATRVASASAEHPALVTAEVLEAGVGVLVLRDASRRRQLICCGRGQVCFRGANESIALDGDCGPASSCSIIGNSVIVIIKRARTHRGNVAAAIHGMAHHGITLYGDVSVALHATSIYIKGGGYSNIGSVIHKTIAAAVHITVMDARDLGVVVGLAFLQTQLFANGAAVDDNGSIAHPVDGACYHFTDIAAAIHVALDDYLRRSRRAKQQQRAQNDCPKASCHRGRRNSAMCHMRRCTPIAWEFMMQSLSFLIPHKE